MNDPFLSYCDQAMAACGERIRLLRGDSRGDEARFEQIRSNVFGIFRAVYAALHDQPELMREKLSSIPGAWKEGLALAEKHGDAEKAHIERIKLDTAEEIRRELSKTHPD